ncbi:MAG: efflux RND transporter periplasmic adaptor subunit [Deltaproteobacteria bacterium]
MKGRITAGFILALWIILSAGCSGQGDSQTQKEKPTGRAPVAVDVTKAVTTSLTEGVDVVGSLLPKFTADVRSEFVGIVTEVYVTEWVRVKKGTPLAKIDTRELQIIAQRSKAALETAKANLLQAEVAGKRAEREYQRLLKLKEFGLVTQQNLDEGTTEKEASAARIEAAKAQLNVAEEDIQQTQTRLSKTVISSPIDGVVSLRNNNVGDLVGEPGAKPIFRIINTRILELTVTVPSSEMGGVRVGQFLSFSTDAIPGKTFTGKVMFINPVVTEADRSVKVVAEVDNANEELKGGLFVKGRIITGKRTNLLSVPRAALLSWDVAAQKGDLFVVQADMANRRIVQTGSGMGDFVEITSGLAAGDPVVTRGAFNLKDGDRVNVTQVNGG